MVRHPPERPIANAVEWIHTWSQRQRRLAGEIEGLRESASCRINSFPTRHQLEMTPRPTPPLRPEASAGDPRLPTVLLQSITDSILTLGDHERRLAAMIAGSRTGATARPRSEPISVEHLPREDYYCDPIEVVPSPAPALLNGHSGGDSPTFESALQAPNQLDEFISAIAQYPVSPFDEVLAAISESSAQRARRSGPLPPPERFRVRVTSVGQPHRATKRNYDYFDELNMAIRAKAKGQRESEQLTE